MMLNKKDQKLVDVATELVKSNCDIYADVNLHVGCALRGKSGKIYKGINLKTSHSVCAEQVAIGHAFASGEREFDCLVAVKMNDDGSTRIVSPCGLCRYIFEKLDLEFDVILKDKSGEVLKVKSSELLPFPYDSCSDTGERK